MEEKDTRWEELKVAGDQLVATIKDLIKEGNVRRLIIKNEEGETLLEVPLTVGVVGVLVAPVAAALGALAALVSGLRIVVEKVEKTAKSA
ncbi:MAG: DUF4342 domain-containing protein [Actinomycetota bacterium]